MAFNDELVFGEAQREKVALKLCLSGVTGAGKTMGALIIAKGMLSEKYPTLSEVDIWKKIAIIDTENRSGSLYVNYKKDDVVIGKYNTVNISAPFSPARYIQAMQMCEDNDIEVCIIDSLSHAWTGQGGLLDKHNDASKKAGTNSYTAWRDITPLHNKLVDKILQSEMNVIVNLRSKMEHVMEQENGKTVIKKVGMSSIFRDGIEYEFTMCFDIDNSHTTFASKDRSGIFDQRSFVIDKETGKLITRWLNEGEVVVEKKETISPEDMLDFIVTTLRSDIEEDKKAELKEIFKTNGVKSLTDATATDYDVLLLTYSEFKKAV